MLAPGSSPLCGVVGRNVRVRFGQFELDSGRYELVRAGAKLEVRPKVFDALRYLLEHAGRLVTKQELLEALWEGRTVEEASVPWTISHVRRAIGQLPGEKGPLETIHGRGYRWSAPVEIERDERAAAPLDPERIVRPFVGRDALLAALRQRLHEVRAGHGNACLLVGDAGIGKSRCIEELAAHARAQGCAVWIGRPAPDALAPVYFPWIQLLGAAQEHGVGPQRELRALLARLSARAQDVAVDGRDALLGQLSLFAAVSRWLREHSRRTPLLLVLEDVHWADQGSLELLGFVAAELSQARILVVAATRHVPAGRAAELLRGTSRFDLTPLALDDVALYLREQMQGSEPAPELCEALHRVSAGYPLFLQDTVNGLLAQHGTTALATLAAEHVQPSSSTRDALDARLSALAPDTRRALACASVLGEELDTASLLRLVELPHDALLRALDEGMQRGLLRAQGPHRFRFRHALFRELLYEAMAAAERAHLHRKVALLRAGAPDAAEHKSEIAHHHYRSLSLGHHRDVREAALAAAELASRAFAFADAAQFCGFALEALALDPHASKREYAEVLLARARAQRYGSSMGDARRTVAQLCEVAAEQGFGDLLVHAARVLRVSHAMGALPDPLARGALERALELLPESALELRLQAQSMLTWLPPATSDLARCKQVSAELLAHARSCDSREPLAEALTARLYVLSGPDDIDAQLAVSTEVLALDAEPRGWLSLEAHTARCNALLLRGDLVAADAALAAMREVASRQGFLELRWHCERLAAQRQLYRGEFAAARAELTRLEREAARLRVTAGPEIIGMHQLSLSETLAGMGSAGASAPARMPRIAPPGQLEVESNPGFRVQLARVALKHGMSPLARSTLAELSADGCATLPKDFGYLHTLGKLGLLAVGLRERGAAEQVLELLTPYASFNTPSHLGGYDGPVAYFAARVAAFLGRDDAADRYFAHALELDERLELWPLLAIACFVYARWSLSTGRDAQGHALRRRALDLAGSLGMRWLAQRAGELPSAGQ